jgi:PncC family amidohydrolase
MTAGMLTESLVCIPGSGEWLAGGVIAYLTRVKRELLGVTEERVISRGAAIEMAAGVARLLRTDVGISTTGSAGPETMEGQPVGATWVGVAVGERRYAEFRVFGGDPAAIRAQAVCLACDVARQAILTERSSAPTT